MRNIKVYSTSGRTNVNLATEATTFSQLKNELDGQGISTSSMKCVIGESKLTLESDNAILPETDFTLFIMPKKTKSGADYSNMSRTECYAAIKGLIETQGETASNHFNSEKNYTNKTTSDLKELLNSFTGTSNTEEVSNDTTTETSTTTNEGVDVSVVRQAVDLLESFQSEVEDATDIDDVDMEDLYSAISLLKQQINGGEIDSTSNEVNELDRQARELAREFDDVR